MGNNRYNALSYRTVFWNAERHPIRFGINAQGRVIAITNAIGKVTSFTFDDAGNLTDREDAKNEVTHYAYDSLNHLVAITNEGVWKASFEHDPNGNITEISNQVCHAHRLDRNSVPVAWRIWGLL